MLTKIKKSSQKLLLAQKYASSQGISNLHGKVLMHKLKNPIFRKAAFSNMVLKTQKDAILLQ